ncbi:hypothetical protein AaE_002110 [Aphanomyces astaci]|uniref:Uncharacterized protein n=1 Tax=Aphanomyces astaci TaxID=112090 RepID=A0A6A5AV99_APHAT|nr:hypothetical protein AaE_002110 [Aphanomyces astaci]
MVQAGVVPRVLPFDSALVDQAREDMGRRLDAMLQQGTTDYHPVFIIPFHGIVNDSINKYRAFSEYYNIAYSITTVDWTDLMTNQFPTGYHLISHPHNNNQLKQKLATMLEMYAPSLKTPSFLDRSYSTIPRELRHRSRIGFVAEDSHVLDLVHALDQSKFDVFLFTVSSSAAANVARQLGLRHVGANKWSYFLSFAKLAPVQAAWALGHSDTSGVRAIDYVVTSEYEYPDFDRQHYSETPFALK